jgi:two-component system sensor histidine kinase KdpD
MTITRKSGSIDVHVVSHDYVGKGRRLPRVTGGLTSRRRFAGLAAAAVLLSVLTLAGTHVRSDFSLTSDMLLYLLAVVIVSVIGGFYPAFVAAVAASLLLNYYFVPPLHKFTISEHENVLALGVFVLIASLVSRVVDVAARRSSEAARSNAEAETLSTLAGSVLRGEEAIPALLERVQETFTVGSVTLLRREVDAPGSVGAADDGPRGASGLSGTWTCLAFVGADPCMRPEDGDTEIEVSDELKLVLRGRILAAEDLRVLTAFAAQVAVAYRQRRLAEAAEAAVPLAQADKMRTALLNAVSHDLRTPLASAKAAVSSLRSPDVSWTERDRQELLANADDALDRLTALVTNLLDLSRLQAGVLSFAVGPVGLDDVVGQALAHVDAGDRLDLDVPATLPTVEVDAGLLERVLANLIDNALRYSAPQTRVRVAASAHGSTVELRVIDHGPGVRPDDREAVFAPFQRLNDFTPSTGAGVGLGLAIARGFTEAMRGSLLLEDTPGGGLTAVVALPAWRSRSSVPA